MGDPSLIMVTGPFSYTGICYDSERLLYNKILRTMQ